MDRRRLIVGGALIGVLLIAVIVGVIYYGTNPTARARLLNQLNAQPSATGSGLLASGFIEADQVQIGAELGGRVVALPFEKGDEVEVDDTLVQLDTSILDAQRRAAEAQVAIAQAQHDLIARGVRDEQIRQAEAQVAIAQAGVAAAKVALGDAAAIRNNPQDIQVQITDAQTQLAMAQDQLHATSVQAVIANKQYELYTSAANIIADSIRRYSYDPERTPYMTLELAVAPQQYDTALKQVTDAQNTLNTIQAMLDSLQTLANDPQQLQAQVIAAQTQLQTSEAQLAQAQAALADMEAGPKPEQVDIAQAKVQEAQAALAAVQTQIGKMTLVSPINGVVLEQSIHVGELASPGVPIVTLANLDVVNLTVYIAADQFDRVALNQAVSVRVDSFPDRQFAGTIIYISDQAEFTPRNVQTREERVNLVYAVKIRIENPDHALKPGMPADAFFNS